MRKLKKGTIAPILTTSIKEVATIKNNKKKN
jgi:hypothetical protein